jgi:hypothetical protein
MDDRARGELKSTAPADSHMLSHCSTNAALHSLTLEIGRDPVFSGRYGRTCESFTIGLYKGFVHSQELSTIEDISTYPALSSYIHIDLSFKWRVCGVYQLEEFHP